MNTYKITNITDKLGKRDNNFNSTLKISYTDEMVKKDLYLEPKNTIYFSADSLPLSVQKFKVKNLVSVSEISEKELTALKERKKPKSKPQKEESTTTTTTTKKVSSKKSSSKSTASSSKSTSKSTTSKRTESTTTTENEDIEE